MAMTSALWLYMRPRYPKPSAHEIITGHFVPNEIDEALDAGNDFGTTIAVMSQDEPDELTADCLT